MITMIPTLEDSQDVLQFTREQVEQAFKAWETELRLKPEGFLSASACRREDISVFAKLSAAEFIRHLNNL
jgi:hypothetical protein